MNSFFLSRHCFNTNVQLCVKPIKHTDLLLSLKGRFVLFLVSHTEGFLSLCLSLTDIQSWLSGVEPAVNNN